MIKQELEMIITIMIIIVMKLVYCCDFVFE